MPKHIYGLIKDRYDPRDYLFSRAVVKAKLPREVDLRSNMPTVYDQGALGSCTANAGVGLMEFVQNIVKTPFVALSRLFLYYQTRVLEDTVNEDAGGELADLMKAMTKTGVCPEVDWPYVVSTFTGPPSDQAVADAISHKITAYHRVQTLADLKAALAEGHPVVMGMEVYESFESDKVTRTGVCPMPGKGEQLLGGHAVLAVGYKDGLIAGGCLVVRNSWGLEWGKDGYFEMSYKVFDRLVIDAGMDMWVGM